MIIELKGRTFGDWEVLQMAGRSADRVVCCARCNRLKSNQFTYEQMIQIGALINSWRNNGNN